jgi:Holliday junction resolvase-like predicted endonuclease
MTLAAWLVRDQRPERIRPSDIQLEKKLEDWIVADPGLVREGLLIVERRVKVGRGRLDLLGLDPAGRWVVLELKQGTLYGETVGQILTYVASIRELSPKRLHSIAENYLAQHPSVEAARRLDAALPEADDFSPPEVAALLVGASTDPGLEPLIDFLSDDHGVDIAAVTFEVFELEDDKRILTREITESAPGASGERVSESEKLNQVLGRAEENGDRAIFKDFLAAGERFGLHARPYKLSVMFTPPENWTRMLFTIWTRRGASNLYSSSEAFSEFFPEHSPDQVQRHLGPDGYRELDEDSAAHFIGGLERLFAESEVERPKP